MRGDYPWCLPTYEVNQSNTLTNITGHSPSGEYLHTVFLGKALKLTPDVCKSIT